MSLATGLVTLLGGVHGRGERSGVRASGSVLRDVQKIKGRRAASLKVVGHLFPLRWGFARLWRLSSSVWAP